MYVLCRGRCAVRPDRVITQAEIHLRTPEKTAREAVRCMGWGDLFVRSRWELNMNSTDATQQIREGSMGEIKAI